MRKAFPQNSQAQHIQFAPADVLKCAKAESTGLVGTAWRRHENREKFFPKNEFHGSQAESVPLPIRRACVLPVHPIDVLRRCIQTGCPWMQISKGVSLALRQRDEPQIRTARQAPRRWPTHERLPRS